ncbi:protein BANP-like isoform X4 [Myxocyprinus asiaticus]|nr:protein BANP-like isoform X4 [Myxocyprinus asiaticus]
MMSEQDLVEIVQIAVADLNHEGHQADVLENNEEADQPMRKRSRMDINQETSVKSLLVSISQAICQRLDSMEAKLQVLEATCRGLVEKLDVVMGKNPATIQVPMVAGSPFGATQTCDKVRCVVSQTNVVVSGEKQKTQREETIPRTPDSLENLLSNTVGRGKQKTIVLKVPVQEEIQEDQESGSEMSDSVSNSGQLSSQNANNVTLITLNSEEDYPTGTWLGDENNPEMRVRCPVSPADMLHISTNCRTAEKMALTLLDYLFHREVQAVSNLSGLGKHGKKQLDPLMIYGIRYTKRYCPKLSHIGPGPSGQLFSPALVTCSTSSLLLSRTGIASSKASIPSVAPPGVGSKGDKVLPSKVSPDGLLPRRTAQMESRQLRRRLSRPLHSRPCTTPWLVLHNKSRSTVLEKTGRCKLSHRDTFTLHRCHRVNRCRSHRIARATYRSTKCTLDKTDR